MRKAWQSSAKLLKQPDTKEELWIQPLQLQHIKYSRSVIHCLKKTILCSEFHGQKTCSSEWVLNSTRRLLVKSQCLLVLKKEVELKFMQKIMNQVEKYQIPSSLVINLDQTPSKYIQVSSNTIEKKKKMSHKCSDIWHWWQEIYHSNTFHKFRRKSYKWYATDI